MSAERREEHRGQRQPVVGEAGAGGGASFWEEAGSMLRAIKALAAADGLSAGEEARLREHMVAMGVPAPLRAEVEAFDPASVPLDELLGAVPSGGVEARRLLVGAIAVAVVDGYSADERRAIRRAGARLGLSSTWVEALELSARLGWMIEATGDDAMADLWGDLQAALLALPA